MDSWLGQHRDRRQRGAKHPVEDFLFTYYSQRPAQLRRWHPGAGIVLAGGEPARDYIEVAEGVTIDPGVIERRRESIAWIATLLGGTAARPANFGCFGLHEWAMVYRQDPDEVRHNSWPDRKSVV